MLVGTGVLIGIVAGGGVTTDLSDDVTAEDTTIPVDSTRDFIGEDYIIIGADKIFYTDKTENTHEGT